MLFILLLVIIGVVMLVWVLSGHRSSRGIERSDAVAILKERYARGEIGLEEYEERKRNLEK